MGFICVLLLIFFLLRDSSEKRDDKKKKIKIDNWSLKYDIWQERVENISLERAISEELRSGTKLNKEIYKICDEIGLDSDQLLDYEVILLLMVNRGHLPADVTTSTGYYEISDYRDDLEPTAFKENALKIIPWVINRLKDFYVFDNVYAALYYSSVLPKYYVKVGSNAYNYLIDMGVRFYKFVWEPALHPADIKYNTVEEIEQISEKDMVAYKRLAKRLKVTEL